MKYFLLCLFWIIWCFFHSFFTSTKVTGWFTVRLGKSHAFYKLAYNILSLVSVLILLYWQRTLSGPVIITLSPLLLGVKYVILFSSAAVVAGSFFTFNIKEFFGIEQIITRNRGSRGQAVIAKHGFYGFVRHPMYLGGCIFFIALMTHAPLAQFLGSFILAVYMVIGTFREDRRLARELGAPYREYQKEVPMFIPRLRRPLMNKK